MAFTYEKIFSERLKLVRKEKKLTQKQIAKLLSIDEGAIGHWEHERGQPSFSVLCHLADALGVSLDWLVGRTDDPEVHKL